ncbi:Hpt domain-containing protein [Ideonella sp. B508-1]|uniref:Hpt domain-containing protein n=1 Tax=Ideonella sp. B508-1 TaxID=137716 RepID=UPI000349062D|nr:Hpt domain-containing protein [Ideonella sp. B508-1]
MFDTPKDPRSEAGAADSAASVLDAACLDQLRALDPVGDSFLQRVLQTYQRSLGAQEAAIGQAFGAGDTAALSHAAHALKSASASVGALQLSRLCAQMEQAVRDAQSELLPALVTQFQEESIRVHDAVARLLGGGVGP